MRLGAHMSIAGGVANAFDRGERAGCEAMAIFLKNNNQWAGKPLTDEDRLMFRRRQRETKIRPVVAHNGYLINLCSPNEAIARRSFEAMLDELRRAEFLGVGDLALHPGAPQELGEAEGLRRVAEALSALIEQTPGSRVRLLLETTAGQGSTLGWKFEHLAELIERTRGRRRLGVCLDTCHIFNAGYDIRSTRAYEATMREFDRVVGLRRIRAFHLNDSKTAFAARRDRHEHIGRGQIGLEGFRHLVNDERFAPLPGILETPKGEDLAEDIENLRVLRSLVRRSKGSPRPSSPPRPPRPSGPASP